MYNKKYSNKREFAASVLSVCLTRIKQSGNIFGKKIIYTYCYQRWQQKDEDIKSLHKLKNVIFFFLLLKICSSGCLKLK